MFNCFLQNIKKKSFEQDLNIKEFFVAASKTLPKLTLIYNKIYRNNSIVHMILAYC